MAKWLKAFEEFQELVHLLYSQWETSVFDWLSYTELRVTAGEQISDQLCCMSDHFSEIMKYSFSIIPGHLLWLIVSTV